VSILSPLVKLASKLSPEAAQYLEGFWIETRVALVHRAGRRKMRRLYGDARDLKVNFGCGTAIKPGFLNLDYSPQAAVRLDLRRPIPLPDGSCAVAYSEHFVEHLLYPEGAEQFFAEAFRVLAPGGCFSVSVPDTAWPLREYALGGTEYLAACERHRWHPAEFTTFVEHLNFHFRQRPRGSPLFDFEAHRFAWDFETMEKRLRAAGFSEIRRREFDPGLDSEHRRVGSLFVEAIKR
jgi:predicted SAM-dependent methyltransferase